MIESRAPWSTPWGRARTTQDTYDELVDARESVRARLFGEHTRPRIGRFELVHRLGAGAMGIVYAARDPHLDRLVALKLLRADAGCGRQRLQREAQALARVAHENVARIYDVGEAGDELYIAMELVDGVTLDAWLDDDERTTDAIVGVFLAAGRGLAAAHEAGVVHRDFKPQNVLVRPDATPRVVDFGLAQLGDGADRLADAGPTVASAPCRGTHRMQALDRLTRTGAVLGTPAYMSPEQLEGQGVDARSDQFSFCVALYEALYGTRPFAGANVWSILGTDVLSPRRRRSVPAALHAAVLRGLAARPDRRHQDMNALLAALGPPRRRRSWVTMAVTTAASVATVVVGTVWISAGPDPSGPAAPAVQAQSRAADVEPANAEALDRLGHFEHELGFDAQARVHLEAAYFAAMASGDMPTALSSASELIYVVGFSLSDPRSAATWAEHAEAALTRVGGGGPEEIRLRTYRGNLAVSTGRTREGMMDLDRAYVLATDLLGPDDPRTALCATNLGRAHAIAGDLDRAGPLFERALARLSVTLGEQDPQAIATLTNLGNVRDLEGRTPEALELYERAWQAARAAYGSDDRRTAIIVHDVGTAYAKLGDHRRAVAHFDRARRILGDRLGSDHPELIEVLTAAARSRRALGDTAAAETLQARAQAIEGTDSNRSPR